MKLKLLVTILVVSHPALFVQGINNYKIKIPGKVEQLFNQIKTIPITYKYVQMKGVFVLSFAKKESANNAPANMDNWRRQSVTAIAELEPALKSYPL